MITPHTLVPPQSLNTRHILILLAGRMALNTAFRMIYPLLAFLAAGLEVDLRTASLLVTIQVGASISSPLGGALADWRGERTTMVWGLFLFILGALVCALAQSFVPFLVGYGIIGLSIAIYHPSGQAYASARTEYSRRGRILGLMELSWAFAALFGVVLLTQLAEASNAWAPLFWVLLGTGLVVLFLTLFGLPDGERRPLAAQPERNPIRFEVLANPSVIAAMGMMCSMLLAAEIIFVVYADWLQTDFGATTEQLGFVFGLLGFVELGGSLGSAMLVDRLGKRRSVIIGFIATTLALVALPLSAGNWPLFLVVFLAFGLAMEFGIVSAFPLISGLMPTARGTVLSLSVASIGAARVIGSLTGPMLWQAFGFYANGWLASSLALLSAVICLFFVREGE